ncbi:methyl jasmonate esterase 1-like [Humulus lupulus]|uniref:methyl jasmonate esterase 1-like n=1 Tax=Humulus lupulus TaxID=3486 RepID=UPI002B4033B1|nr:methyl jasmonate esterase 1-like [Humulus lupulus]
MKCNLMLAYIIIASILTLSPNVNAKTKHSHFVLVHGAGHGAWCWYKVTTLLQSAGHNVTNIDLTASGINLDKVSQVNSSVVDYAKPLMDFMESLPATVANKVVLVSHSLGGLSISLAMESFPYKISAAVFVTSAMPAPNLSFLNISQELTRRAGSFMDSKVLFENGPNKPPTSLIFGPIYMATKMYQLSPPQDLVLAMSLVRAVPFFNNEELVNKQVKLTKERYGSVKRVFIVCDQDLTLEESFQRWMIERNPPHEVKVINGTDHMAMFTKPLELFTYLGEIAAEKYSSNLLN